MATTLKIWLSLAAPEPIPANGTVCAEASSLMVTLLIGLSVGGSFTAVTVRTKAVLALLTPSLTVTVMVLVPFWSAAGVICKLRENPLPLKRMLLVGTNPGLEEAAESTRLAGALSISAKLNANESTASSLIV